MKSASHIRKKVSEGNKSYAALRLLDDKIDRCFLNSTVEESSMELFKKLFKSLQLFYNMELKNLSTCFERCYQIHSKCSQETTQIDELITIIHQYSDAKVNKTHEDVLEFKEWLLNC